MTVRDMLKNAFDLGFRVETEETLLEHIADIEKRIPGAERVWVERTPLEQFAGYFSLFGPENPKRLYADLLATRTQLERYRARRTDSQDTL